MSRTTPRRSGPGGGALTKKRRLFYVRAPPLGPLQRGVVPLIGYPPSSQGFLSPPWARTWDHELRYPFEVVPTTNWATFCKGPTPLAHSDEGWSHSQAIGACPMPFSFTSVRARTQDQMDILKRGALSLPTELLTQLVVRVLPISICPFGLGFELSRR